MITIIAFLILLGVLVVIHEGGHFFVLRMCKVHVDRFSVGMGPVIYKKKDKKGTEFALSALPLGGYVSYLSKKALDADPEMKKNFTDEQLDNLFETKPKWGINYLTKVSLNYHTYKTTLKLELALTLQSETTFLQC